MIPANVLIVEDERIVALHLRQQLSRLGYGITAVATSGNEALHLVSERRPDLVLMDIHIEGDIDGIETAARIPAHVAAPVVYLTAYSEDVTLDRARATSPYGFLLKPFSERELHAALQMVLERHRSDSALRENERKLECLVAERTAELVAANKELRRETTERLKAERKLLQSQKMEALGQLTGGIAHDFNNVLTVILGNIETIERSGIVTVPRLQRALDSASRGVQRAASLTSDLLAFARRQPLLPNPIVINELVIRMSDMLARTLGESVTMETILEPDLWSVMADENQLENSLLNLALNARDAMPKGGRLLIETANAYLDAMQGTEQEPVAPGPYTMIAVSDTGIGMSKAVIERAFEPFFTTKEFGKGTGLGLSQVYGFVRQSGGHIKLRSHPNEGSTIHLYLPRTLARPMPIPDPTEMSCIPGSAHGETVVIVEDDAEVRGYTAEMLRELGYGVVECADGPDVLLALAAGDEIDLVFLDIGLPGIDGRQLAGKIRLRWPDLPILFTTGYDRAAARQTGQTGAKDDTLVKPFTYRSLGMMVRAKLDQQKCR